MVSLTEDLNGYIHNESVADKLTTGGMIPLELQADYLGCLEEFQDEVTKRLTNAAVHDRVLLQSRGNLITEVSKNNFDRMDLCQELIQEELEELQDELDAPEINPEKVLKELCDVLYVVFGFASRYKELKFLPEAFIRVHHNNMTKVTKGHFRGDGKLVKPADHKQPDLSDLIEKGVNYGS
jgi:hypothetical protein